MALLRVMTKKGEAEFRKFLEGKISYFPDLNVEPFSIPFNKEVKIIKNPEFKTKLEMVEYLDITFTNFEVKREDLENPLIWTWLAYYWFDMLTQNKQKIMMIERYICQELSNHFTFKKHLIAPFYIIYSLYKYSKPPVYKIFLYNSIHEVNPFMNEIGGSQNVISNKNLLEVIYYLYFDEYMNIPKKGFFSKSRPGNLFRFLKVINQLSLNYDIYGMDAFEIIDILPAEFNYWKSLISFKTNFSAS